MKTGGAKAPGNGEERYVLIAPLPVEVSAEIKAHMAGVPGTTVPPLGYHVTVLGPFAFRAEPQRGLSILRQILLGAAPLTLELRRLGYFRRPDDNVLFLHVDASAELLRLHNRLLAELGDLVLARHPRGEAWDRRHYTPHVSLGLHIPDTTLDEALAALHDYHPTFRLSVHELWLLHERDAVTPEWALAEVYHLRDA